MCSLFMGITVAAEEMLGSVVFVCSNAILTYMVVARRELRTKFHESNNFQEVDMPKAFKVNRVLFHGKVTTLLVFPQSER
jgi:hypothetical protein